MAWDLPAREARDREVAALLLADEARTPSLQLSNYGGWHSEMTLHERPEGSLRELMRDIVEHTRQVVDALSAPGATTSDLRLRIVHAWAMVMRAGDYTILHDHGGADWSTVYYPDVGDTGPDPDSGTLAFSDPRRGVRRPIPELNLFPAAISLPPRRGSLIIFPGWLQHQVYTYQGQRPRISVAANLVMER